MSLRMKKVLEPLKTRMALLPSRNPGLAKHGTVVALQEAEARTGLGGRDEKSKPPRWDRYMHQYPIINVFIIYVKHTN